MILKFKPKKAWKTFGGLWAGAIFLAWVAGIDFEDFIFERGIKAAAFWFFTLYCIVCAYGIGKLER